MKALAIILALICTITCLSFNERHNRNYNLSYSTALSAFNEEQSRLLTEIQSSDLNKPGEIQLLQRQIDTARLKLKNVDFWLRYFEPNAYRLINGPMPVEWENEVFEKFEAPYRREGAGLSLAQISLGQKPLIKDSLISLIKRSLEAVKTYQADSITAQLNSYSPFFLANRLFLLNLAAIYTTGFECPDSSRVIPELQSMMRSTRGIYLSFNQSFPSTPLSEEYLGLYDKMVAFAYAQPTQFSSFNVFDFIKNYVNPLFSLNQQFINAYNVTSLNFNDYTLNNSARSIFDKTLYTSQNIKGIYSMVEDENQLREIRRIGKMLFYDPILSGNNMRSCASCHKPTEYFTDTAISTAVRFDRSQGLPRNTPTLINSVYNHLLMLDGKHISLQAQGKDVITSANEMNGNEKELLKKIMSCKEYRNAFRGFLKLTPEEKEITLNHVVSAITFYDGSYSRFYAPFDHAMNDGLPVADDVKKGFNLFMSKAKCGTCHFVPNFNGVKPPFVGSEFEVLGTPEAADFKSLSADEGRYQINKAPETLHAFRTGSIRNAEFTGPYMHNGVFRSLDEVIAFYDAGGGQGRKLVVENQTLPGDSLRLTFIEKKELLAFIHALNEDIIFEEPPAALPASSDKALNNRKVGGVY